MNGIHAATLLLLLFAHGGLGHSGLRTFFEMQQRVWISESDLTTVLLAAGTPKCLQHCIKNLVSATSDALKFNGSLVTGIENLCKEYKEAKKCVDSSNCSDATVFEVFTKGLKEACGDNFNLIYLVKPCLDQFAESVLKECDADCELTMTVEQLAQNRYIKKLVAKGGKPIGVLQHLGPTCSTLTCFLSCAQKGLNQKCPMTGNVFVEVSIKPIEHVAQNLKSISPGFKDAIKKKLPMQCRPLLDIDYLNRLKLFGSLPDKKPQPVAASWSVRNH